jgi:glutathione S-transferase
MKLYRFPHSPYARKVQMVLDLLGRPYTAIDVPYGDRTEYAKLTGGYIHVPVIQDDDGRIVTDSRRICEHLLAKPEAAKRLVPSPLDGPIWAYHDWCDGPLEDVLFRIASPASRDRWPTAWERALYVTIKERKFGAGCVDEWERNRDDLIARGRGLLAPSDRTLSSTPFLFGADPTLADAALYGLFAMLHHADVTYPTRFGDSFPSWMHRMEEVARARR